MKYTQEIHGLLGSKKDIEALAQKDHARVLIISDSHGRTDIFLDIVKKYGAECNALIFCGDGIGDLVRVLDSTKTDKELKKALPPVIAFVRGNGDPSSYPTSSGTFISVPDSQLLQVNGHTAFICHGHYQGVDFGYESLGLELQLSNAKVAFHGHTHIAVDITEGVYKFVNPGSCARPRGGQPSGFAIATFEKSFIDIAFIKMERAQDGKVEYHLWNPIY